ncbi:probable carboxylesterase 12 [Humulus lupulus]|uniref:probable carboxylesterase 12 n=1 Tax=Humulus lupulus TaxID=3486 RepID=UPI002B409F02|nr:probable carboxylesterase 12 [Humulus lupulus]XP_062091500.1 probable carboxylesterase 12 [Humulus lupulus]
MASMENEIAHDFSPLLKVYKDGRLERLTGTATVPPSLDPRTGVHSNDVAISSEAGVSARLYLPAKPDVTTDLTRRVPLLVYFHGGGFCVESAASPVYHNYLNSLSSQGSIFIVSVDYRLAPEHPLPAAYEDSWAVFKWALNHSDGNGPNEWLNSRVDFGRIFLAGDSAGANIVHHMALRAGLQGLPAGANLKGIVLVHPYFWGKEPIGAEANNGAAAGDEAHAGVLWKFVYPSSENGSDDPFINPNMDPNVGKLGCGRVLVCVAEKDGLKDRGWFYSQVLKKSGWGGSVEVIEAKGEGHVFHLFNPNSHNAGVFMTQICNFINQ